MRGGPTVTQTVFPLPDAPTAIRQELKSVVSKVGVFGTLALLHDLLDKNPGGYETYPVMQSELRYCSLCMHRAVEAVSDPIDDDAECELIAERRRQYGIVELHDR